MSEQQFRVIADRSKGDYPRWADTQSGDRFTHVGILGGESQLVRIERPVPTADEPHEADATPDEAFDLGEVHGYDKGYAEALAEQPSLPTRKQIAEAIERANVQYQHGANPGSSRWAHLADAVLALLQKEADR